ncbi:MAG: alpha/beta hydrolase [Rhodospirillales bacterium CG15_BIG_FIL_POST_REV_8_21_14_020_66_15]|nr:MAG: alpha/beta hydrolase [Rhodospirillales bacterium CG15_BIG_FIL_POST_REV_8_21_14_020_66_15]
MAHAPGAGQRVLRVGPVPEESEHAPLVFIHGAFAGAWTWAEHFLDYFADQGFSCQAVNLPGRKGMPDHARLHEVGIQDFVDAVVQVVDSLTRPPVLIGHSMGGFVAQRVALEREVAAAVLMSSVPPTGLAGPSVALALSRPMLVWEIARIESFGAPLNGLDTLHQAIFNDHMPRDVSARLMPRFQMESRRAVIELHAVVVPPLAGLRGKPVLVLGAGRDNLIPPAFVYGTAAFLGTQAHIFEDMGHAVMLEADWVEVADAIVDWLREIDV